MLQSTEIEIKMSELHISITLHKIDNGAPLT